jgi:para-nitrobenzyl esterase
LTLNVGQIRMRGEETTLAADPHATAEEALRAARHVTRDTSPGWPAYAWARLQATCGSRPVSAYCSIAPRRRHPTDRGTGGEVGLVFGKLVRAGRSTPTDEDRALSDRMQRHWVNFAIKGDPNGAGLSMRAAFTAAARAVMRFGADPGAGAVTA